jgi:hypothetical protein
MPHEPQKSVPVVTSCPLRARIKMEFPFLSYERPSGRGGTFASHARKGHVVTTRSPDLHPLLARWAMAGAGL